MFYKNEKLAIVIDGQVTKEMGYALDYTIDFKKLKKYFSQRGQLLRISFFARVRELDDGTQPMRKLLDWLDTNGFNVFEKDEKEYVDPNTNEVRTKCSYEVDLTLETLNLAEHVDHIVLLTSNNSYASLAKKLQAMGKRVSIMSTRSKGSHIKITAGTELVRAADNFIELNQDQMADEIGNINETNKRAA